MENVIFQFIYVPAAENPTPEGAWETRDVEPPRKPAAAGRNSAEAAVGAHLFILV
jgi:hypothetical protein